MRSTSLAIV